MQYDPILIPTDFSPAGEAALHTGLQLAHDTGASVVLLTVVPLPDPLPIYPWFGRESISENLFKEIVEDAKERVADLATEAATRFPELAGRVATEVSNERHVGEEIVEAAERLDAGVIVISSHGHRGWRRAALGSVAEEVIRQADGAVMLCPPLNGEDDAEAPNSTEALIVVGVDLDSGTSGVLQESAALALKQRCSLKIVHAVEPLFARGTKAGADWLPTDEQRIKAADEALAEEIEKLTAVEEFQQLDATGHVLVGRASEQVCAFAQGQRARLIVLANRGLTGARQGALGSTADRVLRMAMRPVLTLSH